MSRMKEWIVQIRYPYTAVVIATVWLGAAMLVIVRDDADITYVLTLVSIATMFIALIGFSGSRR